MVTKKLLLSMVAILKAPIHEVGNQLFFPEKKAMQVNLKCSDSDRSICNPTLGN